MKNEMEINQAIRSVLAQLSGVIAQLPEQAFATPVEVLNRATIGQHVRHTLEFFVCLINGYEAGAVNYDKRRHDQAIENSKHLALAVIEKILLFLEGNPSDKPFALEANYNLEEDTSIVVSSTFSRELVYNIEHAIHHMAIIKIGVKAICPSVVIPQGFGVATSTIKYQKVNS